MGAGPLADCQCTYKQLQNATKRLVCIKISLRKRKKYADNKEYRETQVAKERNKYAENQREAGMELDEVREKELFEQMLTAQANLLKFVADVVVCRAQCERLQQPRA